MRTRGYDIRWARDAGRYERRTRLDAGGSGDWEPLTDAEARAHWDACDADWGMEAYRRMARTVMGVNMYEVSTSDADLEAGYPEWSESCKTRAELKGIADRAERYGIPANRLTVTETWADAEMGQQFDEIGSLEQVLANVSTEGG